MYVDIEDWKNGWYGIELGLARAEIDELISLLQMIKDDPDQHFHISSEHQGEGGVGDIEVYVNDGREPNNMFLGGKALGPGDDISVA
ncbi:MAG: hypothetical protein SD837_01060 [Candidatus Electrothrix scaldis]|nr:MAG: hypothetical protein SD837_01060 [Candidatus Electrothrix sp. GW3-3]